MIQFVSFITHSTSKLIEREREREKLDRYLSISLQLFIEINRLSTNLAFVGNATKLNVASILLLSAWQLTTFYTLFSGPWRILNGS